MSILRGALFEKIEAFQNLLISYATGGQVTEEEFKSARDGLLGQTAGNSAKFMLRRMRDLVHSTNAQHGDHVSQV
jgi:hypothetical protein